MKPPQSAKPNGACAQKRSSFEVRASPGGPPAHPPAHRRSPRLAEMDERDDAGLPAARSLPPGGDARGGAG